LKKGVEERLLAINAAMSTYLPDSEISRFNRWESLEPFPVSEDFAKVLRQSFDIHTRSGGVFDPTLGPLINLWGFGAAAKPEHLPNDAAITELRGLVGMDRLRLEDVGLIKSHPAQQINLSAIAKGFAVDEVSAWLSEQGFIDHYVEIGGEVVCRGRNAVNLPWRIGIQTPAVEDEDAALRVVALDNLALATSGDYRNFNELDARRIHHILDPRSGRPALHDLASVSVLAADCMTADAIATALFVMGADEGMAWLSTQPGVEAFFIQRSPAGFRFQSTPGFRAALLP
jgi:thiamine biosynthesis lipoprotein